jgi:hypothetical protein
MPYLQIRGRKPFERASKIAHAEVINNPAVQSFVQNCELPDPPTQEQLQSLLVDIPPASDRLKTVIAIDGGMTETWVREEYPSASVAFFTLGPLLLRLEDLADLDKMPFIAPEDMQRLKSIQRYSFVLPTKAVKSKGAASFSEGVRAAVHQFLGEGDGHLQKALAWLLFREWLPDAARPTWVIPHCPNRDCSAEEITFRSGEPASRECTACGRPIYLSDALRLHERIDDELGAAGIVSYLLTSMEQIVLVHLMKTVWEMKPTLLGEILFVKDGPLAYFGVTAPLFRPMRELMRFLGDNEKGSLINLVGLEKSGPFVEHAALIEDAIPSHRALVLSSSYIYRHITPGPVDKEFGRNTYYGAKVIFRGPVNDTYVATVPTLEYSASPSMHDLLNAGDVLRTTASLRCSMYDNALVPVVLANRLVSLADVPSSEILKRFAKSGMASS